LKRWGRGIRALACVGIAVLFLDLFTTSHCVLCGNDRGRSYQAPVLLDVVTGQVGELTVWESGLGLDGAPSPEQSADLFRFHSCCGLTGYRADQSCHISVPPAQGGAGPLLFCRSCRRLVLKAGGARYLLLDLYDLEHMAAYPLLSGASYRIRDYQVSIAQQGRCLAVTVTGRLFD